MVFCAGRAQAIGALLKDTQRLREEREAFAKKRRTYTGYSRDEMTPARSASTGLDGIGGGNSSLRRSVRPVCRDTMHIEPCSGICHVMPWTWPL